MRCSKSAVDNFISCSSLHTLAGRSSGILASYCVISLIMADAGLIFNLTLCRRITENNKGANDITFASKTVQRESDYELD